MKKILKLFFIGSVSGTTLKHLTYRNIPVTNILGIKEKNLVYAHISYFLMDFDVRIMQRYFKQNGDSFP